MLDDRNLTPMAGVEDLTFWDLEDNLTGWTAYLGVGAGKDHVSPYAAPARAATVEGRQPLYTDAGDLDTFMNEDVECALRFAKAKHSHRIASVSRPPAWVGGLRRHHYSNRTSNGKSH